MDFIAGFIKYTYFSPDFVSGANFIMYFLLTKYESNDPDFCL